MDPNNNPTPTPNPAPDGAAAPGVGATPATGSAAPGAGVTPETELTTPAAPVNPVIGAAPAAPTSPVTDPGANANAGMGVTPNEGLAAPTPATAAGGMTTQPVNPIINPGGASPFGNATSATEPTGLSATDPIMMPEPAKAPDPVEEELKAPMKAAAPAPGSIGSAVSGPAASEPASPDTNPFENNKQTPSVAFNDPATQPDPATGGEKKAKNKTTLIALIIVAVMVVIALAGVLIFQLMSNNNPTPTPPASNTPNNAVTIDDDNENNSDSNAGTLDNNTISCTRNMTDAEVAKYNDAVSGTINVSAQFDDSNMLNTISLVESVVYSDEDATNNEPVEMGVHETSADDLTPASGLTYYLPVDSNGALDLTREGIEANYQSLDFVCEVL